MKYKSIFDTEQKKDNPQQFCTRIVTMLNSIEFRYKNGAAILKNGYLFINEIFKFSSFSDVFTSIEDILKAENMYYNDIFSISMGEELVDDYELFANIEIIANCIGTFRNDDSEIVKPIDHFLYNDIKKKIFRIMDHYLLFYGYKLIYNEHLEKFIIAESDIAINIDEIADISIQEEVLDFYNYRNKNNIKEKQKSLYFIFYALEHKTAEIKKILGNGIFTAFQTYANNIGIRHNNLEQSYKHFSPAVAELKEDELIEWYDYIYAFAINIYMNIDKVKNININDKFK